MYVETYPGVIDTCGMAVAPNGWLLCNGAAVSRTTYSVVFGVIGIVFGAGDGATTFNVPDLRDLIPIGAGDSYSIADTGGAATVTLDATMIASHTHTHTAHNHNITDPQHTHTSNLRIQGAVLTSGAIGALNNAGTAAIGSNTTGISLQNTTATNQNTGGGLAHNNLPPYLAETFIIKY
jgi:microcystin-dependent protein